MLLSQLGVSLPQSVFLNHFTIKKHCFSLHVQQEIIGGIFQLRFYNLILNATEVPQ